eukprot:2493773-Lingulodinium_polyedra.AAC.1
MEYPQTLEAAETSSKSSCLILASCAQIRSAPDSLRHLPADPQLVTFALSSLKGPGWSASPTRHLQVGPWPPGAHAARAP